MKKIKLLWQQPKLYFEESLPKKVNWWRTLSLFSLNGIMLMHYTMKSGGYYDISTTKSFVVSILTLITLGVFYGIISNLIVGLLISLTGHLFNAQSELKKIYNALTWTYLPLVISIPLLFSNLIMAKILLGEVNTFTSITLSILVILSTLIQVVIGIWQIILLYKGLKVAQSLNATKTILNYILGFAIFGILNFYLIKPYLG